MHTQPRGFACLPVLSLRNKAETGVQAGVWKGCMLQLCSAGSVVCFHALIASLTYTFSNE